jgi:hypothetical protein
LRVNFNVPVLKNGIGRRIPRVLLGALCASVVKNYLALGRRPSPLLLMASIRDQVNAWRERHYTRASAPFMPVPSTSCGWKLLEQAQPFAGK